MIRNGFFVLSCLAPLWAAADDVVLKITPASPAIRCEITAISVKTASGTGTISLPRPIVLAGSAASLTVSISELPAEVAPISENCWAPGIQLPAATPELMVWASATILGGIAFEKKSEEPRAITGSVVDPNGGGPREPVACALESKLWRCVVPAGRLLHLQVAIDDFAPLFVWGANLAANAVEDTGIHTLVRGASVAGLAMIDRGRPAANARVRISPWTAGHQTAGDRAAITRETKTDAGGHFQLTGLEPGVYRIVSAIDGQGDAVVESVELRAGEHLQLHDPLVHAALAELIVLLSPPVSPSQTPWSVELLRPSERDMEIVSVAKGAASHDGQWRKSGLQPMSYHLRVFDSSGSQLVARDIVLRVGREQIAIDVSVIRVTGKILAGENGVAADVTFDNNNRQSIKAASDAEGAFVAEFPVAGLWRPRVTVGRTKLRLEPVEIDASGANELILNIPGGGVRGKVVNANGKPAANVLVLLDGPESRSSTFSDADGEYQLVGVDEGAYTLEAESADHLSAGPLPIRIARDRIAEMDLRLESWKELVGVMTTASGAAASGAVVRTLDPATGSIEETISDARGAFSFQVKPHSSMIDLIVLAPPAPIAVRQIAMGDRRLISANVQLVPVGTKLRLYIPKSPPWPTLTGMDGVPYSLGAVLMPLFERGLWREFVDGGFNFHLEPGVYRLCYADVPCRDLQLAAHAETIVNLATAAASNTK